MSKKEYIGAPLKEADAKIVESLRASERYKWLGWGGLFIGNITQCDILRHISFCGAIFKMLEHSTVVIKLLNEDFAYKNSKEYIELECSYNRIIKDLATLFEDLGVKDSIEIALVYKEMQRQGHFSVNDRFEYTRHAENLFGLYGTNIISGEGNSTNINCMLADLLTQKGTDATATLMLMDCDIVTLSNAIYSQLPDWMKNPQFKNVIFGVIKASMQIKTPCIQAKKSEVFDENMVGTAICQEDFSSVITGGYTGVTFVEDDLTTTLAGHKYYLYGHPYLNDTNVLLKPKYMVSAPSIELEQIKQLLQAKQINAENLASLHEKAFHDFYGTHQELYELVHARRLELISACRKSRKFRKYVQGR